MFVEQAESFFFFFFTFGQVMYLLKEALNQFVM